MAGLTRAQLLHLFSIPKRKIKTEESVCEQVQRAFPSLLRNKEGLHTSGVRGEGFQIPGWSSAKGCHGPMPIRGTSQPINPHEPLSTNGKGGRGWPGDSGSLSLYGSVPKRPLCHYKVSSLGNAIDGGCRDAMQCHW